MFSPPFAATKAGDVFSPFRLSNPESTDSATNLEKNFYERLYHIKASTKRRKRPSAKSEQAHKDSELYDG
jgi:hypothetical protein